MQREDIMQGNKIHTYAHSEHQLEALTTHLEGHVPVNADNSLC